MTAVTLAIGRISSGSLTVFFLLVCHSRESGNPGFVPFIGIVLRQPLGKPNQAWVPAFAGMTAGDSESR
jgi:hypothetical protein